MGAGPQHYVLGARGGTMNDLRPGGGDHRSRDFGVRRQASTFEPGLIRLRDQSGLSPHQRASRSVSRAADEPVAEIVPDSPPAQNEFAPAATTEFSQPHAPRPGFWLLRIRVAGSTFSRDIRATFCCAERASRGARDV